ncbi:H-NS histone family protein [Paraburkholderia hospita]|nr:H-NS histone family protein [Paraburkholderia hospita]
MDERKRDSMIAYLRHRMEQYGIAPDATGDTWTGDGDMPQWLKQAISAGQRLEHFEMTSTPPVQDSQRKTIDWRDDPFAGSPLARQHAD